MPTKIKATGLVLLSVLSGCFSLSRDAPPPQHYVLGVDRPAQATLAATRAAGPVIGLRPPQFAEYLASPFIVVRRGPHEVSFSGFDRWGEGLGSGINRTLAAHMALEAPSLRVVVTPWPPGAPPDYVIQLHVLRFEGVAPEESTASEGESHLLVAWEILRPEDGTLLSRGTTEAREGGWTPGDFSGLVSRLDAGLGTLAEDLTRALESEPQPGLDP